jgi:hypothetical protein
MRGQLPASRPLENRQRRVNQIPIDPEAKTVVYSQRLDDLGEGEQLLVRAELTSDSRHLNYPARISTRVYLVDEAGQTEPSGRSKEVAAFGGEIGEHNGFNCLPGQGPKTARRVGVLRLTKAANKPLFVNVVATSGDPLKKAKPGDTLKIVDPGFVRVTRFSPELKG